jgi:hypothetical protein
MKEVVIAEIVRIAQDLQEAGKSWHFHMLTPDCQYNERNDLHAFVIENRTDDETYVTYSDKRYMEVGKQLVQMLHGEEIVKETESRSEHADIQAILDKAKDLNTRGIHWHHHMFFPDCVYNTNKGKWAIVFEHGGDFIKVLYEEEPTEDLRKVEVLYYAQKS